MESIPLLEIFLSNKTLTKFISRFDHFGENVQLTFKRQQKFKTCLGGCTSIIYEAAFLLCLILVLTRFMDVSHHIKSVAAGATD